MSKPNTTPKYLLDEATSFDVVHDWTSFYGDLCPQQWKFQKSIISDLFKYINVSVGTKMPQAAVVKMPTGTGKTALMAILLNYDEPRKALVVVPSEALKSQVRDYISARHWIRVEHRPPIIAKVEVFEPSGLNDFVDHVIEGTIDIGVCTTKTLADIHKDSYEQYNLLKGYLQLVFVDEGHREPAKTWSKAVRDLGLPVILFTATPYRNDMRFFRIGKNTNDIKYRSEITFQEAIENQCIRRVKFYDDCGSYAELNTTSNRWNVKIDKYIESLQEALKRALSKIKISMPKIIIRCDSLNSIHLLQKVLNSGINPKDYGLNDYMKASTGYDRTICVAVHDTYKNEKSEHKYNTVSSITSELNMDKDAIFWIHQNKLMEGIDDHNFILISFFEPFSNARSLVQQIGRVIRKPDNDKQTECFVHCDMQYGLLNLWTGYLNYEDIKDKNRRIYGTEEIVQRITESFPDYFYFSNKFSKVLGSDVPVSIVKQILEKDLQVPKATTVFKGYANQKTIFSWLDRLSEWLLDNDIINLNYDVVSIKDVWPEASFEGYIGIYLGYEIKPSDYLCDSLFFDISMVACTFLALQGYIFFRGNSISWIDEFREQLQRLSAVDLQRLAQSSTIPGIIVKQAGFVHSEPGKFTKRRRVEGGRDLAQTAPFLDDHLHAMTSLVCTYGPIQRYLGLSRGRITDGRGTFISIKAYIGWAESIVNQLAQDYTQHFYFKRFSNPVVPPDEDKCLPVHLLCDLRQFSEYVYQHRKTNDESILQEAFEEEAVLFDDGQNTPHCFQLKSIDEILKIDSPVYYKLEYKKGKFTIKPANSKERTRLQDNIDESILNILRDEIIFYVIAEIGIEKKTAFYTDKQFFEIDVPLWGNNRIEALGVLNGLPQLAYTTCEKERQKEKWPMNPRTWPDSSIFSLIDKLQDEKFVQELNDTIQTDSTFFVPDVILCPDQSCELADFILLKINCENPKIVVIHAKQAKNNGTESAVEFAKIQEQIIKNLRLFDITAISDNELLSQFKNEWTSNDKNAKLSRIRKSSGKSDIEIIEDIKTLIRHGAEREIWVFYGQGFRCNSFIEEVNKDEPKYWLRHMAYLLVNANSAADRARAKLKIFTQP